MQAYLKITAPFDGVVTERLVHPGALVGPGADPVLLVIQQVSRLRLVVAVPEEDIGGIVAGAKVAFQCPLIRSGLTPARWRALRMRSIRRLAPWRWNWMSRIAMARSRPACTRA